MVFAFLNLGYSEILLILLVAVLLFGGKLPKVARDAGRWFYDLKRGMANLNQDIYTPPPYEPPAPPPLESSIPAASLDNDYSSIEEGEFVSEEKSENKEGKEKTIEDEKKGKISEDSESEID